MGGNGFDIVVLRKPETCLRSSELVSPSCHWCDAKHDAWMTLEDDQVSERLATGHLLLRSSIPGNAMFVWKMRWSRRRSEFKVQ